MERTTEIQGFKWSSAITIIEQSTKPQLPAPVSWLIFLVGGGNVGGDMLGS